MFILIAVALALISALAVLYPFLRGQGRDDLAEDEGSPQADLIRRWDASLGGLKNTELEWAIGNLAEEDYRWLRRRYIMDAATIMKAMELQEEEEEELLATIKLEVEQVRHRAVGRDGAEPS